MTGWGREGGVVLQQHSSSLRGVNAASQLSKESNSIFNEGYREELFTEKNISAQTTTARKKISISHKDFKLEGIYKLLCH